MAHRDAWEQDRPFAIGFVFRDGLDIRSMAFHCSHTRTRIRDYQSNCDMDRHATDRSMWKHLQPAHLRHRPVHLYLFSSLRESSTAVLDCKTETTRTSGGRTVCSSTRMVAITPHCGVLSKLLTRQVVMTSLLVTCTCCTVTAYTTHM